MSGLDETVATGDALVVRDPGRAALEMAPAFDGLNPRQLALLRKMNPKVPDSILAQGLEVAWSYQLDPYAKEIWFAESKGSILVMIARDGLRKILARNGLNMACDIVRANDSFTRSVGEHGGIVVHSYGVDRGDIVGAWARVTDVHGTERGYFFAPLAEYVQDRGPWKKQRSVMLLAAAERQAARQATPLGGLLVDGEDLLISENERGALTSSGAAEMPDAVRSVVERARALGHIGLSSVEAARMATDGVAEDVLETWVAQAHQQLEAFQATQARVADATADEGVTDAVVVDDAAPSGDDLAALVADAVAARQRAGGALDESQFVELSQQAEEVEQRARDMAVRLGVPVPPEVALMDGEDLPL